jgi:O-antigen/teichoic acid export membrane protein
LMLVSAVIQVMLSVYLGGLLGSNRHVTAAAYQIGFGMVRSGIVLIPLYFWPVVELVFAWQLAASVFCLLLLRRTVWRMIEPPAPPRFSKSALYDVRAFAGGMFGILLISAINTQSDKLVVSKIFTLDELGLYAMAGLVGQVPSMLALPLAVTVLPRLTSLIAQGDTTKLVSLYMRYSYMVSAAAFTAALGILVGAPQILILLLGSAPSAELVAVCRVLALGAAMLAAQFMPYHLAIASGHTRTTLVFGAISAVLMPVAMFVSAMRFGLIGAAIPWLAVNSIAAIYLASRITPRFLGEHLVEWVWKTNLVPIAAAAAFVGPVVFAVRWTTNPFTILATLTLSCVATVAINVAMLARLFPSSAPTSSTEVAQ